MEDSEIHKLKLKTLDHVSFAVNDIDAVIESWSSMYGIEPWTFAENGGIDVKGRPWKIRMAFAYLGPVQVELVQCMEGRIFQSRFLDTWGEGLHHVGFYVDDVDVETANLAAQGAKVFVHDPGRFSYVDSGGPGGAIFELMQRRSEIRDEG